MFKTFSLLWCFPVRLFCDGNKEVSQIRALSKEKAVEFFRKSYPNLDDDGYEKYDDCCLIMAEQITF